MSIVGLQASDGTVSRWIDFAGVNITEGTLCRIIDALNAALRVMREEHAYAQTHTVGA